MNKPSFTAKFRLFNRIGRGFLATGLLGAALTANAADPSTWIVNVNGYTPVRHGTTAFGAIEVGADGRVIRIEAAAPADLGKDARVIDAGGRTMIPGLIDAHAHLLSEARLARQVDLVGSTSVQDAQARIADFLEQSEGQSGWVLGRGWNQVAWPGKAFPTASQLDAVEDKRPVFLGRIDGHAAWANTRALRTAGIDKNTPDPVGGRIMRDDKGRATGVLVDAAMDLVSRHIPPRRNAGDRPRHSRDGRASQ